VTAWRFGYRQFLRELRAGDIRILLLALIVAVGAVTTVDFFADRVSRALTGQAADLLAADMTIHSTTGIEPDWEQQATDLGLTTARTLNFRSVVLSDDQTLLAELKAVGQGYPLRGALRTAPKPFGDDAITTDIPQPGSVWVEPRLLQTMGLQVGDTLDVGASTLQITRVITLEPDRGIEFFNIGPRVMLNLGDIEATQLVQPASRVNWVLLIAGTPDQLTRFTQAVKPTFTAHQHIHEARNARPQLKTALDRAERFLSLAALAAVLLAGVAVGMAARRHAQRHADQSAVMRCLGASSRTVFQTYAIKLALTGITAASLGIVVGYGAQEVVASILADLYGGALPQPGPRALFIGTATGLVTLFGFALPPLFQLGRVSPLRVLRRDLGLPPVSAVVTYLLALATMTALLLWHTADVRLTIYTLAGSAVTLLVLGFSAALLVRLLKPIRSQVGVAWRFGLANIARRANATIVQLIAFGLGIMVLLLLTSVRTDLIGAWRNTIPDDAPNNFLINIQPDQVSAVEQMLRDLQIPAPALYPMVRARLLTLNGESIRETDYRDEQANRLARREFNLSWTDTLPLSNEVVEGTWWDADETEKMLLSVDVGIAERLGIEMGDRMQFQVADQQVEATVSNLRTVEWDSFRVNFFVIASPAALRDMPATYISSIFVAPDKRPAMAQLVRSFPNITVIDVDAIMRHIDAIIERVTLAIELVFGFTLAAGLVILYAAIINTLDERRFEAALLRALGGTRRALINSLLAEFALLGGLAGLLAGVAASGIAWVLAERVLELPYQFDPTLWLFGVTGGVLGVTITGVLATRPVLDHPPLAVLNRAHG
jgi:putative ABC transport system permease protein